MLMMKYGMLNVFRIHSSNANCWNSYSLISLINFVGRFELMDPGEAFQLARTQSLLSTRKRKQGGRVNIMNPSTWAEIPNDDFP